jgi:hypothetical protein
MLHKGLNPKYLIQASHWVYFAEVIKHSSENEVLCLTVKLIIIRPHKTNNQQLLHEHTSPNLPRWFLCKNHINNLSDPILDRHQANQVTSQINPRDQSKLISKQEGNAICIHTKRPTRISRHFWTKLNCLKQVLWKSNSPGLSVYVFVTPFCLKLNSTKLSDQQTNRS